MPTPDGSVAETGHGNALAAIMRGGHGNALAAIMRGATVAFLGSVLGGGLGFVFLVVMAHVMKQAEFGLLVLAVNLLLGAAAVSVAGTDYATVRFVAAASTPGRKRGAMVTPLALVLALNLVVAALTAVFAEPIADELLGQPRFTNALRALALVLPLTVLAQMFSASLSGLEHARGELARKVAEQGGRILIASTAVLLGFGLVGAVLGMAGAAAGAALVVGYLLLRVLPRGGRTEPIQPRRVIGFAWPQTVASAAGQVWQVGVIVILARYESTRTVALFGAALEIARLPGLIYNSFAFRFSPAIARLWEQGERAELAELLKSVTRWVAIVSLPLYAAAIALPGPLLLVFGSRYQDGATALVLIALAILTNALAGPVETALIMTGYVKFEMAANVGTALAITSLAAFWLVPDYGLTGAAISVLCYALLMNGVKVAFVRLVLAMHTLSLHLLGPLAASVVAGLSAAALENYTDLGSSLAGVALLGLVTVAVYALVLVRVVGISRVDRQALALALRPAP